MYEYVRIWRYEDHMMCGNITLISPHEDIVKFLRLAAVQFYPGILFPSENNWNVAVAVSTETAWFGVCGEGLFLVFLKTTS